MTINDIVKLSGLVTSLGMSHWIRSMLVRVRVPGFLAVAAGCAVSLYAHRWFWVDLIEINRPDKHAWVWIAGHPIYLIGGLTYEFQEWKKRAKARAGVG